MRPTIKRTQSKRFSFKRRKKRVVTTLSFSSPQEDRDELLREVTRAVWRLTNVSAFDPYDWARIQTWFARCLCLESESYPYLGYVVHHQEREALLRLTYFAGLNQLIASCYLEYKAGMVQRAQ